MAKSLEKFLSIKRNKSTYETLNVMAGFGDDAREVEVKIRSLTGEEFKRCKNLATESYMNAKTGTQHAQLEEIEFCQQLAATGIVEPNLNNKELREHFGGGRPEELVAEIFPVASLMQIGNAVGSLTSGIMNQQDGKKISEGTDPDKIEEAKN